jgi:hypothetical protein
VKIYRRRINDRLWRPSDGNHFVTIEKGEDQIKVRDKHTRMKPLLPDIKDVISSIGCTVRLAAISNLGSLANEMSLIGSAHME